MSVTGSRTTRGWSPARGRSTERLRAFKRLGVPLVRFTLRWDQVARRRPANPTSPRDRAYDWRRPDRVLGGLRRHGLTPVLTLVGTPGWANGRRGPMYAPPRPGDFRAFARAAATRYPWVRYWLIWNEPNKRLWLRPTKPKIYVRHLLNPAYEGIHSVLKDARVGGGVTGPRGGLGGVAPVAWVRGMDAARAKLDAYAHHPYPSTPTETPSSGGCRTCPAITMATISKLLVRVKRSFGPKPVWLTEYGYQSNPPDQFLGVPLDRQARLVSLAAMRAWKLPRVTMLFQYLYRDEIVLSRFQTGLIHANDRPKPSLQGFRLPFAQMRRSGARAVVWGQIRNGPGRKAYRLEVLRGNKWTPLGPDRLTDRAGVFTRTIRAQARRTTAGLVAGPEALQPAAADQVSRRRLRAGLCVSKPAECRRRSRSSQRAASATATPSGTRTAASTGSWCRAAATTRTSAPSATIVNAITRWKRPASECGQGSSGLAISRPRSESVQCSLSAQALQTCARAR